MSSIVAPPATATDNAKKGIPRLAFREPSIGSTTTCAAPPDPKARSPSSSEISVKSPPVASSRRTIAFSAAASIATVSSPPLPAPTTGSRSTRVGSSTSTPRTSSTAAVAELVAAVPVEADSGQLVAGLVDRRPTHAVHRLREPVRREDRQPLLARRNEHDHHPGARLGSVLGVERERRLVAVMTVGDQELRIREPLNGVVLDTPEPVAADGEVGLALRKLDGIAVMEQEDRLELRPRRAEQPQAALLRAGVRALVRQHDAVLVRLEPQGDDEPVARPLDPVRPEVSLRQPPGGWPGLAVEHALGFPVGQVARGLVIRIGQRQVD